MPPPRTHDFSSSEILLPKKLLPRVLVVERDNIIRDVLCTVLEDDYNVFTSATVLEALASSALNHVDVILLDHNLRVGAGKTVVDLADRVQVPIVWMAGEPEFLDEAYVLPKPFNCQQVLDVVSEACNRL